MKTFTAKQFSRTPAQIFEAAREDGGAAITHDRFNGFFAIYYFHDDEKGQIDDYWSLDDPIPNVYVYEKIDCKRHPSNEDPSRLGVKEFNPANTHKVGDVIKISGNLVTITEINEAMIKYEPY